MIYNIHQTYIIYKSVYLYVTLSCFYFIKFHAVWNLLGAFFIQYIAKSNSYCCISHWFLCSFCCIIFHFLVIGLWAISRFLVIVNSIAMISLMYVSFCIMQNKFPLVVALGVELQ